MKLTYLGHAAFLFEGSKNIIIDPFITGSPSAKIKVRDLPEIDYVLVTHDHFDHLGDAIAISKSKKAVLIAIHEVVNLPQVKKAKIQSVGMNIGGTYSPEKGIAFTMTNALHSAEHGSPAGFVIFMDKKRVYHSGDTALFSDMALIPKMAGGKIDLALLPIGGHYVMDEAQAAAAVKLLKPRMIIPMHYNTWPIIKADTKKFARLCGKTKVRVLETGKTLEIR